jgi:hypothetical protein
MHSTYKAMLFVFLCSRICGSQHSQDKAMLFALLCYRNCGSNAFRGQGYVNCIVVF